MRSVIYMQLFLCVVATALCIPALADIRDQTILNWLVLPSLLVGGLAVMFL